MSDDNNFPDLDLTETERKALQHGVMTEEQLRRTRWWSEEMDRCRQALARLLTHARREPDLQLISHGTSTDSDGDHEVRMVLEVKGEGWEPTEVDA